MKYQVVIKRIYEEPSDEDGQRILIDRLWPRGLKKGSVHLDEWIKTISPSDELRKWFAHDPAKFDEFAKRYKEELENKEADIQHLRQLCEQGKVTLLYAAKDEKHNNAVVLLDVIK